MEGGCGPSSIPNPSMAQNLYAAAKDLVVLDLKNDSRCRIHQGISEWLPVHVRSRALGVRNRLHGISHRDRHRQRRKPVRAVLRHRLSKSTCNVLPTRRHAGILQRGARAGTSGCPQAPLGHPSRNLHQLQAEGVRLHRRSAHSGRLRARVPSSPLDDGVQERSCSFRHTLCPPTVDFRVGRGPIGHGSSEHEPKHFGSGWLLLIPVLGPPLFQQSFCSDAKDYYREHPSSDEPQQACDELEIGLPISRWLMLLQATGAGLIASSYLLPSKSLVRKSSTQSLAPQRWYVDVSGDTGIGMIRAGAVF